MNYVILSLEHRAWWRPGGRGYTCSLSKAGRFSEAEAASKCNDANHHDLLYEVAMPDTLAASLDLSRWMGPEWVNSDFEEVEP